MFKMLIDTCVWLDLAKDPKQLPVLGIVEELIRLNKISIIVPRVVLDEFRRNRERIGKESAKSLSTHFRLVKEAVGKIGGDEKKMRVVLSHLDDVDHMIPIIGGEAVGTLYRIEKLLTASPIIETSEAVRGSVQLNGQSRGRLRFITVRMRWLMQSSSRRMPTAYATSQCQDLDSRL